MLTTLFRALNGLLLAFALPFFPWHGDGGRETAQFDLTTIQMPKKFRSHVITGKSYFIAADQ